MNNKTVKDYDDLINYMQEFTESANDKELSYLNKAIFAVKKSKLAAISDKKTAITSMYESGYMDENEFVEMNNLIRLEMQGSIG